MKKSGLFIFLISIFLIFVGVYFRQRLAEFQSLGLLGLFLINFLGSATIFFPAPGIAAVVAGGTVYPPPFVAFTTALGAAFGEMVGFLLGASGRRLAFRKKHHFLYMVLKTIFDDYGVILILLFSLIPNPFFDAIGILAGIFSFSAVRFFGLVLVGRFIRDLILAFLGSQI